MFTVKVCGVTRAVDAQVAVDAGADAIGLNFYPASPRYVTPEVASNIVAALTGHPLVVGVFVNATAAQIAQVVAQVPLGAIQLHGDEPPELVAEMPPGVPVIRAARIDAAGVATAAAYRDACAATGQPLAAVLLDASVPTAPGEATVYGGSGHRLDWPRVAAERHLLSGTPLVLAGGLTPENVAEAITTTGCEGVDTASGVELSPGVKSPQLVRDFVREAQKALRGR
ncbi:N-(5'-phosphoribosyl)anthranilate isomerase [Botrimarina colliarenosi]|uniref:N-(5'-phosphoribosyl)anthranilate isomerase n=1 Tax=Botrimarina colliarenosi TaxID=2528001 RepID=A0A5C6A8F8_9BACT|nr:phosphoribosylanthranilate isomerase [Botrimarina colliarenosi]TWT95311.1 N-(5'-phosphoribosyl)anthranilate isomerase [Botrimarina colliarenosi]